MINIRDYTPADAVQVGQLIADVFGEYTLGYLPPEERPPFMGPFQHAYSDDLQHRDAVASVIASEMVYVAEEDGEIMGVLRGRKERLGSLFVRPDRHRQGIATRLVERFERECRERGYELIRVASSLYGIPFYESMGYKRSTGVRLTECFDGHGLPVQPMKKALVS
jgi:GNAT superfamily N-acetyltransferase